MKERNIATAIILSLVTCGIYGLYWMVVLTDELKEQADDHNLASGGLALLFTIFTCGIYGIYWAYQMGKLLSIAKEKNGLRADDNSVVFLVLELFGLGIVVYALAQSGLNDIYYNKRQNITVNQNQSF